MPSLTIDKFIIGMQLFLILFSSGEEVKEENYKISNYIRKVISFLSTDYHEAQDIDSLLSSPMLKPHHCKVESRNRHGAIKVLILGDSINKFMVDDLCLSNPHYNISYNWANVSYTPLYNGSCCCNSPHFSLCTAHIYGSAARGPYAYGIKNDAKDLHVDTELRIPQCMGDYIAQFGHHPEFILLRTELWDIKYPFRNSTTNTTTINLRELSNQFIKDFRKDLGIIRQLSPHALLGTHTVPKITWGLEYFHTYLNAMRYLSEEVCT